MEAIRPSSRTILVADLTEGELPALSKITFTIPSPTVDTHKVVSFNSLMECTYFTFFPSAITVNAFSCLFWYE